MSTVEEAVKQAIEDFAQTLTAFSELTGDDAERFRIELGTNVNRALEANLPYIFTGGSSRLIYEIINNRHGFSGNSKHCNNCGADFCTAHSLTHCVKCNHTPLV